jgi:diguanylate cyclase (GGDEF)-like protein/PAS domain S-box-containing protein
MVSASIRLAVNEQLPVLSVSDSVESLLGYRAEHFLSGEVSFSELIHPHDQDIADTLFARDLQNPSGTFNIRLRHASGRIRCMKGSYAKGMEGEAGELVVDLQLTCAKSLPRTLGEASTTVNFRAMMENTDDFIYFKDRNHVFTGASQTLVSLCDPAEHWTDLLGQTDYDVFAEEFADVYYRLEKQVFAGVPVAHEIQEYLARDGRRGWVDNRKYPIRDEHGEIIGLYGIARDTTEQKRAQASLQASEERLRLALAAAKQGWFDVELASGAVTVSPEYARMFGYEPDGFQSNVPNWLSHVHPDDRGALAEAFAACVADGGPRAMEYRRQTKAGGWKWIRSVGQIVQWDEDRRALRMIGIHTDITERKASEEYDNFRSRILEMLAGGEAQEKILEAIVTGIEHLQPAMLCSILLLDGEGERLCNGVAPSLPDFYNDATDGMEIAFGAGSCGTAAFTGERVIVEDVATHPYWENFKEIALRAGLRACWSQPIRSSSQQVLGTFAIYHRELRRPSGTDITLIEQSARLASIAIERSQAEKQIRDLAYYDSLTHLPNRRLLHDRLALALAGSKRSGRYCAAMLLDLDNFKPLNDEHGHLAGDLLLIEVARRLAGVVREVDTVARLGGDEFVVVLGSLSREESVSREQAMAIAEKIRAVLAVAYVLTPVQDGKADTTIEHHCSASVGVTLYAGDETNQNEIIKRADMAMYQAKQSGRNSVRFFAAGAGTMAAAAPTVD